MKQELWWMISGWRASILNHSHWCCLSKYTSSPQRRPPQTSDLWTTSNKVSPKQSPAEQQQQLLVWSPTIRGFGFLTLIVLHVVAHKNILQEEEVIDSRQPGVNV